MTELTLLDLPNGLPLELRQALQDTIAAKVAAVRDATLAEAEAICRGRADKHLNRKPVTKLRREWALEAQICADTIAALRQAVSQLPGND